mmetsp:Transcript_25567/g.60255  ORF Transcript_25567/g.60255 Transcript_25567/m.60255 type:complete len:467 (+) Transcript_25567:267-1667(+)|eukprot:CAMPEP_0172391284 /NCGR_PEP_ID=MMETSP1061-20121228/7721_1 /TAXON_ID=37318 /ORGANISM="Pseudo-nitzschia pungens, Strain cf. pungens" /LENGTH=466 /DNA_ID=CAMNT_0013121859 /DNA_START=122 /DNA_END=1522 /DNA_ORIENTATION=-
MTQTFGNIRTLQVASFALVILLTISLSRPASALTSPNTVYTQVYTQASRPTRRISSSPFEMRALNSDGGESTRDDSSPVKHVVIAGAGVVGVSTAYYLAKQFGVATTLIDPTGTIAPAASGKAGGFLALNWNDHSPALGPLTRRSFALHQEIADELGADNIQYRRLECVAIPVGDNNVLRRPSGRKLEGIEWAEGQNAMGDASVLGDESTIAQVHPKKLCEAMWEKVLELTPESTLVSGKVVSTVDGGSTSVVGAKLDDGSVIRGDALLYSCGPWTANNMYGTKYHSLVVPTTKVLNQCVFFSGLGDPEVYVRSDSTAYCTGFPDPPVRVTENPGEEEVRKEAIDKIQASVEAASSFSDDASANYLVFSGNDGDDKKETLEQACYLPSTVDGVPMMGEVPGAEHPGTYVCAGHTCWGILMGPASGEAMAHEIVTGRCPHVNLKLFSPQRFGGSLQMVPPVAGAPKR